MLLSRALRANQQMRAALVGAGGKTTAMFQLARQLRPPVLVCASTHLAQEQLSLAGRHYVITSPEELKPALSHLAGKVLLFTGPVGADGRTRGLDQATLQALYAFSRERRLPLLVEADGAGRRPLKAPAGHEPAIPAWSDTVIVVAGLSGIGQPLNEVTVHRPQLFQRVTGLAQGERITPEAVTKLLTSPEGGLKNIPAGARRITLLNQADSQELQALAGNMAERLLSAYAAVVIAALENKSEPVSRVCEKTAGVLLAAGGAERYGRPKILLDWRGKPFIRHIAETALKANLDPVVVVLGAVTEPAAEILDGLPVQIVVNSSWKEGQSSSVRAGVAALPANTGSAVFLLADQPQVTAGLIRALAEAHSRSLSPLAAPYVRERRATPTLFDRVTFPDLAQLSGDAGGRALFHKYDMLPLPWDDPILLLDVDTPEDYRRLLDQAGATMER